MNEDQKQLKRYERWLKKQAKKPTGKELEEIKKLQKQALSLWKKVVKIRAGNKCEAPGCKKTKRLNAHHIESFSTNKTLRHSPANGLCLCSTHHKFGRVSAHKSFIFLHLLLQERPIILDYLVHSFMKKEDTTIKQLKETIQGLENSLKSVEKEK